MPFALVVVAVAANVVVLLGRPVPWLSSVAGCALLFGLPICLLYSKLAWRWADPDERLGYALVLTLLLLMGLGLALDVALPHVGVTKPLERLPILLGVDALLVVLSLWRPRRWPSAASIRLPSLGGRGEITLVLSGVVVLASIAGAIRLNNGTGSGVTLVMLVTAAVVLVLLIAWRESLEPGVVTTAIYCVALALLLMTSLRGWYITGHDIQLEYRVFELTKTNGSWSMSRFRDSYNACLSITILPTLVAAITRISDPYVYKLLFQMAFAYCPVFVYKLARRYASKGVALLAAILFMSFPTFFNDMPFLNRQEIAFLFVAAAFLVMANRHARLYVRRSFIVLCFLGVVVSHYSTTYVLVGTVAIAWLLEKHAPVALSPVNTVRRRRKLAPLRARFVRRAPVIGLASILILIGASLLWTAVYTHTVNGLGDTLSAVVQTLRGSPVPGTRSADVSYGLFSFGALNEHQVLRDYATSVLKTTQAGRDAGIYYPLQTTSKYPTPIVAESNLPVTSLGRELDRIHLSASAFNSAVRQAAARIYQVLLGVGLLAALFGKRRRFAPGIEFYALAWGATIITAVQVVLPVVSVDYGILRAFQQALIILAPFVAIGTVSVFQWLGDRWSLAVSSAVVVLLFLSLSGVMPQALGGYPPQLNLNNAGLYYDLYYVQPQEVQAIQWLRSQGVQPGQVQAEVETDRYTFDRLQSLTNGSATADIWPSIVMRNDYVFLGAQTVQKGQSAIAYDGDIVLYKYPVGLLDREKNLIYASSGAWIYR